MTSTFFPLPINGFWSDDETRFILNTPFVYQDEVKDILVTIPAGFSSDFNSVPRAVWGYFPPWQHLKAGLVHDWLYAHPERYGRVSGDGPNPPLTRQQCDDIHRRILDLEGCRWSKRQTIYTALRIGGGGAWNRHREVETRSNAPLDSAGMGEV